MRRGNNPVRVDAITSHVDLAEIARLNLTVERAVREWVAEPTHADNAQRTRAQAEEVVRALRELRTARAAFGTAA